MTNSVVSNQRILIIDDNPSIFSDFKKVLAAPNEINQQLKHLQDIFSDTPSHANKDIPEKTIPFELDFAQQGQAGLEQVVKKNTEGQPYALVFVDMRMPPGWDGIETISQIFKVDKEVQAVICTAYSDYSWTDIIGKLGNNDRLLILKKPFDEMEVRQLANTLTHKWCLNRQIQNYINKWQRAIEASSDGIVIFSMPNASILYFNSAALHLLGVKELENNNFLTLLTENNFDLPDYKLIEKSIKEQKPCRAIFRLQREKELPVCCEIHLSPIPNTIDGEQVDCFIANLIDITQNQLLAK